MARQCAKQVGDQGRNSNPDIFIGPFPLHADEHGDADWTFQSLMRSSRLGIELGPLASGLLLEPAGDGLERGDRHPVTENRIFMGVLDLCEGILSVNNVEHLCFPVLITQSS